MHFWCIVDGTDQAVIDIQDFAALALWASYNSAGLAQKKKTLALIENKFTCPGQAWIGTDTDTCLKLQTNLSIPDNHCYTVQLSYI